MADCLFCQIAAGEIPADKLYEDESVLAFMDIRPVARGHALVIPKLHSEDLLSTDDRVLQNFLPQVKKVAGAVMRAVKADGVNITTNHGRAAGQVVFHLHFHIIPRFAADGLRAWPHHDSEPKTRAELAAEIRKLL
jgi:histidine triad (HIT) family protein